MKSYLKKLAAKVAVIAENPVVKPLEVWAVRAAVAYVALKLGIDVKDLAQ